MVMSNVIPHQTLVSQSPTDLSTQADFNLINTLLKNPQYKIPEYLRPKAINQIEKTLDCDETDNKTKLTAVKTLIEMDKQNLDLIKAAMPKKTIHQDVSKLTDEEILERLNELRAFLPKVQDV
jgi:hypothetical protein